VETETVREAASATEGSRVLALSLQAKREKATTVKDLHLETGKQRFVACIFWESVKLVTVAVAFTTRHAASFNEALVPRARSAHFHITSLLLPPLRATKNLQKLRGARSAKLEAEARTEAEHEARLQVRSAAFVAQDPGEPEAALQVNFSTELARRRKDINLKWRKKTTTRTNPSATCSARPPQAAV
jgi:hypothetical protein